MWLEMGKPNRWAELTARERKDTIAKALQISRQHLEVLLSKDTASREAIKRDAAANSRRPPAPTPKRRPPGKHKRGPRPKAKTLLQRVFKLDNDQLERLIAASQNELARRRRRK